MVYKFAAVDVKYHSNNNQILNKFLNGDFYLLFYNE